jgi:hypothetical protein
MNSRLRIIGAVVAAAFLTVAIGAAIQLQAAPPDGTKKLQIACKPGWRGGAGGSYGGVPFSIACDNGRSTQMLEGTVGTAYSFRMGVEDAGGTYDCFFSGDSQNVNETCVEVRLTIR